MWSQAILLAANVDPVTLSASISVLTEKRAPSWPVHVTKGVAA